jgi:hypothetical protein
MDDINELVKNVLGMLDQMEQLFREKRVAVTMLYQLGVQNVEGLLKENAVRPDVQAALDEELRHLHNLKLQLLRAVQSGDLDLQPPPSTGRPN